ncbi:uncharacterized protein CIMG_08065 [Coccidioides immitis RS]|uniref:Uncharacterized protein n=1 Tax=Coccidioides immitis (strain RS) TaxID=246410 RepID=A0A0D8JX39_COCIM|nr:uncharacterized protein CIMG_08065 [Coccidioides immitis RS]KJF60843.1 hypothetical protein CIMG_08065 [Coccidioides immitis RS]
MSKNLLSAASYQLDILQPSENNCQDIGPARSTAPWQPALELSRELRVMKRAKFYHSGKPQHFGPSLRKVRGMAIRFTVALGFVLGRFHVMKLARWIPKILCRPIRVYFPLRWLQGRIMLGVAIGSNEGVKKEANDEKVLPGEKQAPREASIASQSLLACPFLVLVFQGRSTVEFTGLSLRGKGEEARRWRCRERLGEGNGERGLMGGRRESTTAEYMWLTVTLPRDQCTRTPQTFDGKRRNESRRGEEEEREIELEREGEGKGRKRNSLS